MATSNDPTVSGNLLKIARDVRKLGSAPLGPVSVGPGQGAIRFFDASGDQFQILPSGAWVRFRGGMQSVAARFENDAAAIEGHTATLGEHDGRITVNKNRNDAQDGVLDGHGNRLGSAESRLTGHDGDIAAHNTRINNAQSAANSANTRAGALEGRATTLEGNISSHNGRINTAQSRADSAWNLANGRATTAAVNAAQSRADAAHANAAEAQSDADDARVLANQIVAWINRNLLAPAGGGTFPSDIPR